MFEKAGNMVRFTVVASLLVFFFCGEGPEPLSCTVVAQHPPQRRRRGGCLPLVVAQKSGRQATHEIASSRHPQPQPGSAHRPARTLATGAPRSSPRRADARPAGRAATAWLAAVTTEHVQLTKLLGYKGIS